ncbi:putative DNA-dependent RNA polymerase [Rosellinia necatrix]|uniref:DNA-directed RNA polymerase n=1 Tax=Rosellinia necatrix TaxID=77044 RepID=A0A1W2TEE8_ROSNE|nr:putative DNA-dependent RNA polymerase [Rosellinia necatrix]
MLLRQCRVPGGLSLPRINALRRPRLPPRHASATPSARSEDTTTSGRRRLVTQPQPAPWRRQTAGASASLATHRSLATAVDDPIRQDNMPFADHLHSHYAQPSSSLPLYHLRAFDPTTTLQVKLQDEVLPRSRLTQQGIPGGFDEMISVFDACLDVNKLERAGLVLERFGAKEGLPYADLIVLHNQYLRAGIDRALDQPELQWAQSLHQWFEVQIRGNNIPHTTETIACMLKISLLSARGPRLARLVTRYMDMLPEETIDSLLDVGILNQQDFGTITNIYQPTSNLVIDELDPIVVGDQVEAAPSVEMPSLSNDTKGTTKEIPDVLPVPQKGLGLKTLRGVLSFFNQIDGQDLSKLPLRERREIQSRLEKDCVEAAIQRWKEENQALADMGRNSSLSSSALNPQLYEWHRALEEKLKTEFSLFDESEEREKKTAEDLERCLHAPFMRQSTPERLAAVTIMGVLNTLAQQGADKGVALATLLTNLARIVEEDIRFQARQRQAFDRRLNYRRQRRQSADAPKEAATNGIPQPGGEPAITQLESHIVEAPTYDNTSWPALIKAKVGARLLSALLDGAKLKVVREHPDTGALVSQLQPALARTTVHRKGKKIGMIMPNKVLTDLMKREPRGDYLARHLPMLVEPQPWTKFDRGGFIEFPSSLVRIKNGERDQKIYTEAAIERGDLDQVTKGLDVLGRTAWQINKPVFEVILEAWNTGEEVANIPPLNPKIPIPEEPSSSEDPLARREWLNRVKLAENEKSGLHSERCFMNFQLDIARAFRDQTFYFPHNMDFRGRAYPIPAYLNHMGADHVRGLLRFATGKELGENGLRWLKVQLANVFGYDKASLEERETFAMNHIEDIKDSATSPLTGKRWWLGAEDPWQCLAACFELKAALESPDPKKYVSHLPVHQDGTCNGLQHYAALGGDRWGAEQVNLMPGDRPADVYSAVAELVKAEIARDLAGGNFLAKAVDGKINRKVVKQTVMTNVYGVTFIGAKAQVLKQINAAYPNIESDTGISPSVLASYIATKIFRGLSTMFRGAHDIQYWLGECAGRVCRALTAEQLNRIARDALNPTVPKKRASTSGAKPKTVAKRPKPASNAAMEELLNQFRSTIVWTTPLRMPIVQPYRKSGCRVISTCIQDLTLQIPERSDPVNRRKQLQAFPPNFIHSLDASHMLLSALECDELGLSFAAVHDSFWTHAADVDVMNRVLRDAFVRIHSEDVIGRLASEFQARYHGSLYLAKVERGTDAAREIASFRTKQRQSMQEELLQERERQRLLASSDPYDVEDGLQIVTPASIYEKFAASEPLPPIDDIDDVTLGNMGSSNSTVEDDETSAKEAELSSEDAARMQELMSVTHFEATLKKMKTNAKPKPEYINLWLPLTFPAIPAKGDFDVSDLKSSKYFFS